ncbi:MAG: hydrogenase expression/formation C-terminal domain-containing protein [Gammaproteobacteria bacterium]|jgi:hydrogenase-1 operon protein HyaF
MSTRLEDIPVAIEYANDGESTAVSAQVKALMLEVQGMLEKLVDSGQNNYIDLRSLPMMPGELATLKAILGTGEVQATITALGPTTITETSIPGVWWITHKNAHEEVLSEFIEVTKLPGILMTQDEDLQDSVNILQRRLDEEK